jgi:hypothetical protein
VTVDARHHVVCSVVNKQQRGKNGCGGKKSRVFAENSCCAGKRGSAECTIKRLAAALAAQSRSKAIAVAGLHFGKPSKAEALQMAQSGVRLG